MTARILIFYHSASGNTRWVTINLADALKKLGFETALCNIAHKPDVIDASSYDLIGFGCPVMGFRPSFAMTDFIASIPPQSNIPSFVFTTYAGVLANAPWMLAKRLHSQGFIVGAHKHFRSEVSWPIARSIGLVISRGRPNKQTLPHITRFANNLALLVKNCKINKTPQPAIIPHSRLNFFYYLALLNRPNRLRIMMGKKIVDKVKCTKCGCCKQYCAVGAISLNPYPCFNKQCTGCWGCFNICPEGAISTIVGTHGRYRVKAYPYTCEGEKLRTPHTLINERRDRN